MGIRSEYRRRYDSNAAAMQDAQQEVEEKRRADIQRHVLLTDNKNSKSKSNAAPTVSHLGRVN